MLRSFGAKPFSIRQKKIIQSWVTFFGLNFPPSLTEHAAVVFSGWPCEVWTKPTVASLGHVTCVKQEEFPTYWEPPATPCPVSILKYLKYGKQYGKQTSEYWWRNPSIQRGDPPTIFPTGFSCLEKTSA